MRKILISLSAVGLSFALVSCIKIDTQTGASSRSSSYSSGQAISANTATGDNIAELEFGDAEEVSSSSEAAAPVALPERLVGSGTLEVGNADAPITLLLYTHHNCTYCKDFQETYFPRLSQEYLQKGTLNIRIALLPIQKYANSSAQEVAFYCAAKQGKGLAMHSALFVTPVTTVKDLWPMAKNAGLDATAFQTCVDAPSTQQVPGTYAADAKANGITLVPTFLLNGEKFVGLLPYADLRGKIEAKLNIRK